MSWDISDGTPTLSDISEDFKPAFIGTKTEIIKQILEVVPSAYFLIHLGGN